MSAGWRVVRHLRWLMAVSALVFGLVAMHQLSVGHTAVSGGGSALGYSAGADQHGAGGHARMHAAMSGGEVAAGSVGAAGGSSSLMSAGHGEMPGVPGHCPGCAGDGVMISCLAIVVLLVIAALIGPFGRRSWWLAVDLLDVGAARVRAAAVRERPPLTLMELSISRT